MRGMATLGERDRWPDRGLNQGNVAVQACTVTTPARKLDQTTHIVYKRSICVSMLHAEETEAASSSVQSFHTLMKKVAFVLSGFENPERSNLRDKAIEMGATYKPDWSKDCTHLM